MLGLIKWLAARYFAEILGSCLMGNHFHLLVKMLPDSRYTDADIKARLETFYGKERDYADEQIPYWRNKLSNLSEFMREIKVGFSRYHNRRHNRRGYFWGERFKSVIAEKGQTLVNCLTYIDLNPVRAGLVRRPEQYRWNSLGYHLQTGNGDGFLSTDFGLEEFNVKSQKERLRRYRRHVYEAGAIDRPDKLQARAIDEKIVAKERRNDFEISRLDRFRYRTRYFTDSGIIGSKEFVSAHYRSFKHLFESRHKKKPKPVQGL